jgi:transketolase
MFIAEQNMVSVAVGLSRRGYKPFVSTFAAFMTRAHDQIRMASLSESDVTLVGSHAGVSIGADGGSQMGLSDIAMFRAILGSTVMYPSDVVSAKKILQLVRGVAGVSYVRTTREKTISLYHEDEEFMIGGSKLLRHSDEDEAVIITAGITVHEALKAYEILQMKDISVRVIDLYSIKPIDAELLLSSIEDVNHVIIVEDHFVEGGIGEAVQNILSGLSMTITHLAVRKMPHSGTPEELLQYEKINYNAIIDEVYKLANKLNKNI